MGTWTFRANLPYKSFVKGEQKGLTTDFWRRALTAESENKHLHDSAGMLQQEKKDKIPSGILIQAKQRIRGYEEITEEVHTDALLFRSVIFSCFQLESPYDKFTDSSHFLHSLKAAHRFSISVLRM